MKPINPFILIGYQGEKYFCDREAETAKMLSWLVNGSNVTLISPRRYGKTGLIHNVFNCLPDGMRGIYIDVYSTRTLAEFTKAFATSVVGTIDTPVEKTLSTIARFFRSCRPTMTPQEDGLPKFSFDLSPSQAEPTLREAFDYLRQHTCKLVIAIDEFQQILEYPETGTEALLRSLIQQVPWVRFVFAGSRQHLMGEMFATAKHPFYNSTDILQLGTIDPEKYAAFSERHFKEAGQAFTAEAFGSLYDRFDGVTWYVQRVLNRLWDLGDGCTSSNQVDAVVAELVSDRASIFGDLLGSQTAVARKLLPVLAEEGTVSAPTSAGFLAKCGLSASSVRSVLATLRENDIVYKDERGYFVYERLFGEWLRSR